MAGSLCRAGVTGTQPVDYTPGMKKRLSGPRTNLLYAALFVLVVLTVFTIGYRLAGWSWSDSLYMVVITAFSVGFGEVNPVEGERLRLWTMALIMLGCTGVIFITGTLVQWLTESQINLAIGVKNMEEAVGKLKNHAIVCGFGRLGRVLASQLEHGGMPFVIIDQSAERVAEAREMGWLTLQGEATDEAILRTAGLEHARVLATVLPNDAANVFITLSARSMARYCRSTHGPLVMPCAMLNRRMMAASSTPSASASVLRACQCAAPAAGSSVCAGTAASK